MQLEPTHMMYWNLGVILLSSLFPILNRHIWCIETTCNKWYNDVTTFLNRHIWCIETILFEYASIMLYLLEPTHMMYWNYIWTLCQAVMKILNRHIWCIETRSWTLYVFVFEDLNRHIWCIETFNSEYNMNDKVYLNRHIWCIETSLMQIEM